MLNIVLFGPPGAGKGTQAEFLIKSYELIHLSTGDILRNEIASGTKLGQRAQCFIDKGQLVPDEVVIGMIQNIITLNADSKGFVFDGFPRTVDQAIALDKLLQELGTPISVMLSLDVKQQELVERLLSRGKISGRTDDQDSSIIETRIRVYNEKTAPVIDYYKNQGKFNAINGMGSIEEIAGRLKNVIDTIE